MQLLCQRSFCELLMCAPLNSICNSEVSEFASSVVEKIQSTLLKYSHYSKNGVLVFCTSVTVS